MHFSGEMFKQKGLGYLEIIQVIKWQSKVMNLGNLTHKLELFTITLLLPKLIIHSLLHRI